MRGEIGKAWLQRDRRQGQSIRLQPQPHELQAPMSLRAMGALPFRVRFKSGAWPGRNGSRTSMCNMTPSRLTLEGLVRTAGCFCQYTHYHAGVDELSTGPPSRDLIHPPTTPSPLEKQILTDLNALFPDEDLAVPCHSALRLLTSLFPFKPTETLKLHFGTRSYDLDGCQGFLSSICANSVVAKVPLAFVNLKYIDYRRANRLQVRRASCNEPVRALNKIHHKLLAAENADKDPYIIAVTIALAQQAEEKETDVLVRVLTTSTQKNGDHKQGAFSIYKATVPGALLAMFRNPGKAYGLGDAGFITENQKVAAWPVLGLAECLGELLGVVPATRPAPYPAAPLATPKRKHGGNDTGLIMEKRRVRWRGGGFRA
ncbi:hypothetical protein PG987_001813 [Apiospora arundinis]